MSLLTENSDSDYSSHCVSCAATICPEAPWMARYRVLYRTRSGIQLSGVNKTKFDWVVEEAFGDPNKLESWKFLLREDETIGTTAGISDCGIIFALQNDPLSRDFKMLRDNSRRCRKDESTLARRVELCMTLTALASCLSRYEFKSQLIFVLLTS
ncbi:hypothetical protein DTO013E5_6435 [Penicillium roqueforti]|nr:hypothetical protein CBS147337_7795 [Penicillium roqueforti]KAI2696154.1 hypothetical protein CBS147372_8645 [Penicillium roqueforti]KAI2734907.1 hypothetical protein DTO012A1_9621 [Penicillium roqueforti]KAI2745701.1 hypothetical protein DTO013F2_7389 [Penicillium roqueforti]KAI2757758.1 hypothetical protein DTO006G1_7236 [Penicillium roqueforti]